MAGIVVDVGVGAVGVVADSEEEVEVPSPRQMVVGVTGYGHERRKRRTPR